MRTAARLIGFTQPAIGFKGSGPEDIVSYCARVSNPDNQKNFDTAGDLLRYCIKNKHWSIFDMVNAVVEVEAPRDISRQLLRHSSFKFQEFSQRYSDQIEFTDREVRLQDTKNRQNSLDYPEGIVKDSMEFHLRTFKTAAERLYTLLRGNLVAKETARVVLPEGLTMSRLYMNGTLRSYIHYLEVRDDPGVTQKEHVILAREIREAIRPAFSTTLEMIENED